MRNFLHEAVFAGVYILRIAQAEAVRQRRMTMKRSLLITFASSLLTGSIFAQTASAAAAPDSSQPLTNPVNDRRENLQNRIGSGIASLQPTTIGNLTTSERIQANWQQNYLRKPMYAVKLNAEFAAASGDRLTGGQKLLIDKEQYAASSQISREKLDGSLLFA